MVGKGERGVQLHARHVASDAIAAFPAVRMSRGPGVAGLAFRVVVTVVIPACVLMRYVASRTGEMTACETAAFHQPQRLKADIFGLVLANRRFHAMASTAKLHLRHSGKFARIHWHSVPFSMLRGSRMAALALHSGNNGFEMLIDFRRVAREA